MNHKNQSVAEKGRAVIEQEANALMALADTLGASQQQVFDQAVNLIQATKNRLVISGIGKSGHIARKLAATFASTGQPAFFVHASEAEHGDLGMITAGDTLLLISYSGAAKELQTLLHYAHRFDIPVICITGKADSPLAQHSTCILLLPPMAEACPMGLAPTTSTTMTLALGDALAIALLSLKTFTKNDFKLFHPGGNLGFQLQTITDFMHKQPPLVAPQAFLQQCLQTLSDGGLGCVGIYDNRLHGIITDGDLRRFMHKIIEYPAQDLTTLTAADVMTANPLTISHNSLLGDALHVFEQKSITNLFVVDENDKVVGILHLHDCLKSKAV